jgi:hypothetical protein
LDLADRPVLEAEVLIWSIVQQRSMRHSLKQRENDFLAGLGWRFVNRQDEDDALGTLGYDSFRGGGAFNTIQ